MEKLTMLDYVKETPGVLRTNIEQYTALVEPLMKEVQQKEIKRILLVASGSSHNACYCARSFVEKVSGLEVRIITPYTFTYYENDIKENEEVKEMLVYKETFFRKCINKIKSFFKIK